MITRSDRSAAEEKNKHLTFDRDQIELLSSNQQNSLRLVDRPLTTADVKLIAKSLRSNAGLTDLILGGQDFGVAGAREIAMALRENTTLRRLVLDYACVGDEGVRHLAGALKVNSTLQWLSLECSRLRSDSVQFLADALRENFALTGLNLSANEFNSDGVRSLAAALRVNSALQSLNVSLNHLGARGTRYLTNALCENSTLKTLKLDSTGATEAALWLADMLRENSSLQTLTLDGNRMDDETASHLAGGLLENSTLQTLRFHGNKFTAVGVGYLVEAIAANPQISLTCLDGIHLNQHLAVLHLPPEFTDRCNEDILSYLRERNQAGAVEIRRVKVMVVGPGEAGKTTLGHRLKTGEFLLHYQMTDGIAVNEYQFDDVQFYFWDFAGQSVYLSTHPLFFSNRTIFLLVLNPDKIMPGEIEQHLEAVRNCAPEAPLTVVTTRAEDHAPLLDTKLQEINENFGHVVGQISIDSRTGKGFDELKARLVEVALAQPHVKQQVPRSLHSLQQHLATLSKQNQFNISVADVHSFAQQRLGMSLDMSELVLSLLHDWGVVYVLPGGTEVVLTPQQLTNVLACVITGHHVGLDRLGDAGQDGVLLHSQADVIWRSYHSKLRPMFLQLLHDCGLAYQLRDSQGSPMEVSVVPAMLPERPSRNFSCTEAELRKLFMNDLPPLPSVRISMNMVPEHLIARLQVRLRGLATLGGAWHSGCVLKMDSRDQIEGIGLSVCVVQRVSAPEGLLFLAAGISPVAQSKAIHAFEHQCEQDFPRVRVVDVQITVAGRPFSRYEIFDILKRDGAQACIVHESTHTRVSVAKFARLVGFDFKTDANDESNEEKRPELPLLPDWLRSLSAVVQATQATDSYDDDTIEQLDNELRQCIPHIVSACGLRNHKSGGVRCLWLVEKSKSTTRRAVAVSPPAPNTVAVWQTVELCCVTLPSCPEPAELSSNAETVILQALDMLGIVGAATRFTLQDLSGKYDAIRLALQAHFDPLTNDDELAYSKDVMQILRTSPMPIAPQEAADMLKLIPAMHRLLLESQQLQLHQYDQPFPSPPAADL